jgi:hypothetical protein
MNGYELLLKELDALRTEVKLLKQSVKLLMDERQEKIDFDIQCLKTLKEWDEHNAKHGENGPINFWDIDISNTKKDTELGAEVAE